MSPEAEALRARLDNLVEDWLGESVEFETVVDDFARTIVEELGITEEIVTFNRVMAQSASHKGYRAKAFALVNLASTLLELANHGE